MALIRGVELRRDKRELASRRDVHTKARDEARIADTSTMAQVVFIIGVLLTMTVAERLFYWMQGHWSDLQD